jgi:hypothetical protein
MAAVAPLGLYRGHRRRGSFLLVGESRYPPAGSVRHDIGTAAGVPVGRYMVAAMAEFPKAPVVPFVQVVVVEPSNGPLTSTDRDVDKFRTPASA